MTVETLNRLNALFESSPILRATEVPSDAEVMLAEQQIGIPFSSDYREFLLLYGGAMVGPYPVFGLRPVAVMDDQSWSVVIVTHRFRQMNVPGTNVWTVVSEDHSGNPVGMDRKGAIWIHDHDFGGISPIATDFEEYVRVNCLKMGN